MKVNNPSVLIIFFIISFLPGCATQQLYPESNYLVSGPFIVLDRELFVPGSDLEFIADSRGLTYELAYVVDARPDNEKVSGKVYDIQVTRRLEHAHFLPAPLVVLEDRIKASGVHPPGDNKLIIDSYDVLYINPVSRAKAIGYFLAVISIPLAVAVTATGRNKVDYIACNVRARYRGQQITVKIENHFVERGESFKLFKGGTDDQFKLLVNNCSDKIIQKMMAIESSPN